MHLYTSLLNFIKGISKVDNKSRERERGTLPLETVEKTQATSVRPKLCLGEPKPWKIKIPSCC